MHIFGQQRLDSFVERMVEHIASDFPVAYERMGERGTRDFVRAGIDRAAGYNLRASGAVAAFLELQLDFGESFQRSPDRNWAMKMLNHPTLPDVAKIAAVYGRMTSRTKGRRIVPVLPT